MSEIYRSYWVNLSKICMNENHYKEETYGRILILLPGLPGLIGCTLTLILRTKKREKKGNMHTDTLYIVLDEPSFKVGPYLMYNSKFDQIPFVSNTNGFSVTKGSEYHSRYLYDLGGIHRSKGKVYLQFELLI